MIKSVLKFLFTASVGVAMGLIIRPLITVDAEPRPEPEDIALGQHPDPVPNRAPASDVKESKAKISTSRTTKQDTVSLDSVTDVESILNYLAASKGSEQPYLGSSYKVRGVIRQLVKDNPELGFELLEALLATQDENIKRQLSLALSTIDSAQEHTLEPWLVSRIENGDRPGQWLALLGEWGLKSRSGFDSVMAQLSNNPDPKVISNSIKALDRTLASYPLAMSPNQRSDMSSQLEHFLSSSDDDVRSAAVSSLASFPQDNMTQLLLNAFNDPSSKVRRSALKSYMRSPTHSADIQDLLINQLQDPSRNFRERSTLAGFALTLNLSEHERNIAEKAQQDAMKKFTSLSKEEQAALSREFDNY